jgi:hypothetical protein
VDQQGPADGSHRRAAARGLDAFRPAGRRASWPACRTITGPALWWLALEQGHDYAGQAAVGSVAACALCALFALAYERASPHVGALAALVLACLAAALSVPLLQALSGNLASALAIAALVAGGASLRMSDRAAARPSSARPPAAGRRHDIALTALVAGLVSGGVAWAAPATGPVLGRACWLRRRCWPPRSRCTSTPAPDTARRSASCAATSPA